MSKLWTLVRTRVMAPVALCCLQVGAAWAGPVDIADIPLGQATTGAVVRSNLMFVLDDSGSMNWNYLPDSAPRGNACFGSSDSNLIFYNPATKYLPPLDSDGKPMSDASFNSAWDDGYNRSLGDPVDLSYENPETPTIYGRVLSSPAPTVKSEVCGSSTSWRCSLPPNNPNVTEDYNAGKTTRTETLVELVAAPGFSRCSRTNNSCALQTTTTVVETEGPRAQFLWAKRKSGASVASCNVADFEVVRFATHTLSAEQKQNYANWFSYYRTRMLAMRAGAGRAFAKIDGTRFRVGFSKISEHASGGADSKGFLNIRDYDSGSQKVNFFSRLYSTSGTQSTPLRPALARAGRYYANKLSGQSDPVQYSCQRNYTILSTDGYWNQDDVLPRNLSGGLGVGNPDGDSSVKEPMRDAVYGTGVGETLADVAMYYYENDLRTDALRNCTGAITGQDVCENNVPTSASDPNKAQHMTTFTLGLGLSGTLNYSKDYLTQTSGDYFALTQGSKQWPDPIKNTGAERIDDLWHAAVNGRGVYYSASNSEDLANSLVAVLDAIDKKEGSGGAAATSSLTPTETDDWVFVPLYSTKLWTGDVHAFKIKASTGEISGDAVWKAADRITAQTSRKILFKNGSALTEFTYANLPSSLKAHFDGVCGSTYKLSQCADLHEKAKPKLTGTSLVDYLRGNRSHEMSASNIEDRLFRTRAALLGDIVGGAPVFVGKPPLAYGDGYADYASRNADRQGVLYVAANDGMLHAIKVNKDVTDATGGQELWAYVPTAVMKDMYLLADTSYATKHRFYVDGAPVVADVNDGTGWRTILVGGLGKGGRAYYALDISNPNDPKVLWEFTDDDLGYTFGNPVIAKNKAGKWIVAFTSGYNNVSPGSGKGYLYVLDAITGQLIDSSSKIPTSAGDTATPSNLGRLNAWVEDSAAGIASRFYAGDMLGNVWRFDYDDNLGPGGRESMLLAQVANTQPITTKPVLSEIVYGAYRYPVVTVATGRYLGYGDIGDKNTQSVYTFKDELSTTGLGALRSNAGMVKQTLKLPERDGLDNPKAVDWNSDKGWYVDLPAGERVNVDVEQQLNQLIVPSNLPNPTACSPGGTSWLYYLDVGSGKPLLSYSHSSLIAGISTIQTTTGKLVTLLQDVDGKNKPMPGASATSTSPGTLRRTSWRELAD